MELRSGRVKDFIDLDEYSDEYPSPNTKRYNTRSFTNEMAAKIKTEPLTFYEHELPTAHLFTQEPIVKLVDIMDPTTNHIKIKIKLEPKDETEQTIEWPTKKYTFEVNDAELLEYYRDQLPRRKSKKSRNKRIKPSNGITKQKYCCYLCGRWFPHFCRLKTHMPTHTGELMFSCKQCDKKYTNSSSLLCHRRIHSGEVAQRTLPIRLNRLNRMKKVRLNLLPSVPNDAVTSFEMQPLKQLQQMPANRMKNELPEIKVEQIASIIDIKMEPVDFNDVSSLNASIDSNDYRPFIWNEREIEHQMALTSIPNDYLVNSETDLIGDVLKESQLCNVMNDNWRSIDCHQSNVMKTNQMPNKTLATKLSTPTPNGLKVELWQKETIDSEEWFVDILNQLKPKRNLFPSDAIQQVPHILDKTTALDFNSDETNTNGKCTAMAIDYRNFGDIEFIQKNWYEARKWYNRSICYAKSGTYHLAIAYAKRGQCFFNMGMYRKCWIDLMLAEKLQMPNELMPQLERHKNSCKIMLKTSIRNDEFEPRLSYEADLLFPEMANTIQINFDEFRGQHIVATTDIDVGKIVLIEKGFVTTSTDFYEKCCICLTGDTNMIPCSKCNKAMLCKRCIGRKFHQIECDLQSNNNAWLAKATRSILCAISLFPKIDDLMRFVDAVASNKWPTIPDMIPDMKSKYRAFLQLVHKPTLNAELIPIVADIQVTLLKHSIFACFFSKMKHRRFLSHLIFHHIEVMSKFGIKTHNDSDNGHIESIAPIASYFNHSCAPNAAKFLLGNSVIVVTMRPIKKNEQLLVSYCNLLQNRDGRQNELMQKYGIQCQCERCTPTFVPLNPIQPAEQILATLAEQFIIEHFCHLGGEDQEKRKQIDGYVLDILKYFGRMPWNYINNWAYIIYSMLLSHRFQKKLCY